MSIREKQYYRLRDNSVYGYTNLFKISPHGSNLIDSPIHYGIVKLWLRYHPSQCIINRLFEIACLEGSTQIIRLIWECGWKTIPDYCFYFVAYYEHFPTLEILFELFPKNQWNQPQFLFWAISHEKPYLVKFLIHHGADIHHFGESAFLLAVVKGNIDMVKILIRYGANVEMDNNEPIRTATRTGRLDIISLLIKYGANVNKVRIVP